MNQMTTPSIESVRDRFKQVVKPSLRSAITDREIDLHCSSMPTRYWGRVTVDELVCHLDMQHAYLLQIETSQRNVPIIRWRHYLESDYSEVVVLTSNCHGLLAKITGSFATLDINVFSADVYTREDNVVLDIFKVCDSEFRRIKDKALMDKVLETITKSLSLHGDLPFKEITNEQSVSPTSKGQFKNEPETKIELLNQVTDCYTVLNIVTKDYLGLLHDILQVLALSDVDIEQAKIGTEEGIAVDTFYITDISGEKIEDSSRLEEIRAHLLEMIHSNDVQSTN
jgi:[protein-PII] uridylyltransferase